MDVNIKVPFHRLGSEFGLKRIKKGLAKINKWLHANIEGRYASYLVSIRFGQRIIIIAFENDNDAVMFRLKGGETAWQTDTKDQF